MVNYLCKVAEVSKSGYYRYWTSEAQQKRSQREQQDEQVKEIILKAYHFKRRKKGARSVKMTLEGQFKVFYNLKRHQEGYEEIQHRVPLQKGQSL
ncbi:hypothetical protein PAECIP111891_06052 [Paenibacillus allorhizoplanae]|uniref:IS3 family transposase n=1 Tax=Paenibacillus allorhizoplanae TaxID=2905648 RepID=A0ABM9CYY5_9BACL|nr:hypothetical protein PAECIP111891_06052 [Paenibacillus allorhizoplanae]